MQFEYVEPDVKDVQTRALHGPSKILKNHRAGPRSYWAGPVTYVP